MIHITQTVHNTSIHITSKPQTVLHLTTYYIIMKEQIPTYEVISDYPGNPFKIGQIIQKRKYMSGKWYIPGMLSDPDNYPHIFKRIDQSPKPKPQKHVISNPFP